MRTKSLICFSSYQAIWFMNSRQKCHGGKLKSIVRRFIQHSITLWRDYSAVCLAHRWCAWATAKAIRWTSFYVNLQTVRWSFVCCFRSQIARNWFLQKRTTTKVFFSLNVFLGRISNNFTSSFVPPLISIQFANNVLLSSTCSSADSARGNFAKTSQAVFASNPNKLVSQRVRIVFFHKRNSQ